MFESFLNYVNAGYDSVVLWLLIPTVVLSVLGKCLQWYANYKFGGFDKIPKIYKLAAALGVLLAFLLFIPLLLITIIKAFILNFYLGLVFSITIFNALKITYRSERGNKYYDI